VKNPPSDGAWSAILAHRGFRAVEDPEWKEMAYLEMPEASRKKDSALISEDHRTVALRFPGEWRYFQLGGTSIRKAAGAVVKRELWESLGLGWEAVSNFDGIDLPLVRTPPAGPSLPREWRDSRMIRY
jgi:hypothetical protein